LVDIASFLAPGEECFQVADDLGKVIIPGFPFTKSISPEVVKELKIDCVEIDFVFGVFFEVQEKVFESPLANDGSVGPDGLTALNILIKDFKESPV
jgi:hypothetical protein